jgi:Tfp pilus assembly protein FimT
MAHSLEAALIIPLILVIVAILAGLVLPCLKDIDAAARAAVKSQTSRLTFSYLY